ncbi:MAG: glycosyltransferase [Planctomycetota bacterium]
MVARLPRFMMPTLAISYLLSVVHEPILSPHTAHVLAPLIWCAAGLYVFAVGALALYGLHNLGLLGLFLRHRKAAAAQAAREDQTPLPPDQALPHVLIQLPVFNERDVLNRLLDSVSRLEWPRDRLHIQLLDDSTDDSVHMGRLAVHRLREQGVDVVHLHRTDRTGFKAGALEHGLAQNDAPFVAIFDADFVPNPDFLKRAIKPLLADPGLALVQGRWEHLNRNDNMLTKAQAVGIDGHFAVEQGARAWSGLPMNFNGTCGLWRRAAIIDAGGWEHDTLTEDMDISYRAQLVGWRCTYRLGLGVPGEIPADVNAWRSQQFRWAKGSIQTAIKLLPRIWSSAWDLRRKLSATLHMTHYLVHPFILLSLFAAPLAMLLLDQGLIPMWVLVLGLGSFLVGAMSPVLVYIVSQVVLHGRSGLRNLLALPVLAAIGTGIAISNASAVWQAIRGKQSAFVRTPKAGNAGTSSYRAHAHSGVPEALCALWAFVGITIGYIGSHTWITPFLVIYLSGFGWMSWHCIIERRARTRRLAISTAQPVQIVQDSSGAQPA